MKPDQRTKCRSSHKQDNTLPHTKTRSGVSAGRGKWAGGLPFKSDLWQNQSARAPALHHSYEQATASAPGFLPPSLSNAEAARGGSGELLDKGFSQILRNVRFALARTPATTAVQRGENPGVRKTAGVSPPPSAFLHITHSFTTKIFFPFSFPFPLLETVNDLSVLWHFVHCSFWLFSRSPGCRSLSFFPSVFFTSPAHPTLP